VRALREREKRAKKRGEEGTRKRKVKSPIIAALVAAAAAAAAAAALSSVLSLFSSVPFALCSLSTERDRERNAHSLARTLMENESARSRAKTN